MDDASELLRVGRSLEAIAVARSATAEIADPFTRAFSLSAILIDAGAHLKSKKRVAEGVSLLKSVEKLVTVPTAASYHYNLGNGYGALARFERGHGPGSRPSLARAVSHLDESLALRNSQSARTNLANALKAQGRLVEALDEYERVLADSPQHHQAIANRGHALLEMRQWFPDHSALFLASLIDHQRALELAEDEPVFAASYRAAVKWLEPRVRMRELASAQATRYADWIWSNRLALNPCPLCRLESPEAFDLYPLSGKLAAARRTPPLHAVLDLLNRLCQAYATARWTLWAAGDATMSNGEHQVFVPSGQPTVFGLPTGLAMAACLGFYSVLNNVAFATNQYFRLGIEEHRISLASIWRKDGRRRDMPRQRADMRRRLTVPANPGLTALYGLTDSLERGGGRYFYLRDLRNSIEHHVAIATKDHVESQYYRAVPSDVLNVSAISLGRVAKAALMYFAAAVYAEEVHKARRAVRLGSVVGRTYGPGTERG